MTAFSLGRLGFFACYNTRFYIWIHNNHHGNLTNYVSCCVCVFLACQELPDEQALTPTNFGVFMTEQAVATKKLNEEVEKIKALLKTRGEL